MILYPWIHQHSNNKSNEDRTRSITFPDVDPSSISDEVEFSMAAGDFLEIYKEPGMLNYVLMNTRRLRIVLRHRTHSFEPTYKESIGVRRVVWSA